MERKSGDCSQTESVSSVGHLDREAERLSRVEGAESVAKEFTIKEKVSKLSSFSARTALKLVGEERMKTEQSFDYFPTSAVTQVRSFGTRREQMTGNGF